MASVFSEQLSKAVCVISAIECHERIPRQSVEIATCKNNGFFLMSLCDQRLQIVCAIRKSVKMCFRCLTCRVAWHITFCIVIMKYKQNPRWALYGDGQALNAVYIQIGSIFIISSHDILL